MLINDILTNSFSALWLLADVLVSSYEYSLASELSPHRYLFICIPLHYTVTGTVFTAWCRYVSILTIQKTMKWVGNKRLLIFLCSLLYKNILFICVCWATFHNHQFSNRKVHYIALGGGRAPWLAAAYSPLQLPQWGKKKLQRREEV